MKPQATRKGYTKVPNKLLTILTGEQLRAWIIIRSAAPGFVVSFHYLQTQLGLSERSVRRLLKELIEAGMLETAVHLREEDRPYYSYKAVLPDELREEEDTN